MCRFLQREIYAHKLLKVFALPADSNHFQDPHYLH